MACCYTCCCCCCGDKWVCGASSIPFRSLKLSVRQQVCHVSKRRLSVIVHATSQSNRQWYQEGGTMQHRRWWLLLPMQPIVGKAEGLKTRSSVLFSCHVQDVVYSLLPSVLTGCSSRFHNQKGRTPSTPDYRSGICFTSRLGC